MRQHPFLKEISLAQLQTMAACAMDAEFSPGEHIFREGDPANRFYLIESGEVCIESARSEGPAVTIETLGHGEAMGWSWLFPPFYWHFDARAVTRVKAIFFYGTRLRELADEDHELGYLLLHRMAEVMIRRLQATRKQLLGALHGH